MAHKERTSPRSQECRELSTAKVFRRRTLSLLARVCCAGLLLTVVAFGTSNSQELGQDTARERRSTPKRQVYDLSREFRCVARRETPDRGGLKAKEEFNFTRFDYFLNISSSARISVTMDVYEVATELMHSLMQVPVNISFVDVIGLLLFHTFNVSDTEFITNHQEHVTRLIEYARQSLLALPSPIDCNLVRGKFVQIAVSPTKNILQDPVALCSARGKESPFKEIPRGPKIPLNECYFALIMSNTTLRNKRNAIVAYGINWMIRPLPSIGHQILNSRVVDVVIEPSKVQESEGDQLIYIFFNPSLDANTTKGCSYWSKTLANWTTHGCWVDREQFPDTCHCNLSAHLGEDATGAQYIVYEYSDAFFNETSLNHLLAHTENNMSAESVLSEASILMRNLIKFPATVDTLEFLWDILEISLDGTFLPAHRSRILNILDDARKFMRSLKYKSGCASTCGVCLSICILSSCESDTVAIPRSIKKHPSVNVSLDFKHSKLFSKEYKFALKVSESVLQNTNRNAFITTYPYNITLYPLPSTPRPIYSFRVVDVNIEPSTRRDSEEDMLLSIFFKPSLEANTTKGCSYWSKSLGNWASEGCWVDLASNPDVCHCNMSAHLDEEPTGGQYIVYESTDVFFNETSLHALLNYSAEMNAKFVIEEANALITNLTLLPSTDDTLELVFNILQRAINSVSYTTEVYNTAMLELMDGARHLIRFSEPDIYCVTACGECLNIIVFSFTTCEHSDSYAAVIFPRKMGEIASVHQRSEIASIDLDSNHLTLSLNISESVSLNTDGIAFITYPSQFNAHYLPSIDLPIYKCRVVDVVIEPSTKRKSEDEMLLSIFFKPSLKVNTTKGCSYWSKKQSNWITHGCRVDVEVNPDVCHCNLSAHLEEDATGGQYIVYEYSDVYFNEISLLYLQEHSQDLTMDAVLAEGIRLMHNLTLLPVTIATLDHIWQILNISIERYDYNTDTNNTGNSSSLLRLMAGARKTLRSYEMDRQFTYYCGACLNIFMFPCTLKVSDTFAAVTFPRRSTENPSLYHHKDLDSVDIFSINYTLSVSVSKSVSLNAHSVGFITYPMYFNVYPLPSIGSPIYSFRVVDLVIEPSTKRKSTDNQLFSIFFKPSLDANTTKGCSYWSKTLANWTTEGCWVDRETSPDACHCNLSSHLEEDATGGQYIVYEFSDVFFNEKSYKYVLKHKWDEPTDFFFSEASNLMRNLSLIPGKRFKINRLEGLISSTLIAVSVSETNNTMTEHIKSLYLNARNILKSDFEWSYSPKMFCNRDVAIIFDKPEQNHQFTVTLRSYFNQTAYFLSTENNNNSTSEVAYSLTLSLSVAKQNEYVSYMIFPIDQLLFSTIENIFEKLQVHNYRVVDITLVPRAGVESEEHQFIDIRYNPSVGRASNANTSVGCAFWSDLNFAWTTEGCEVSTNATPPGCQCNLSAHFDENREGGQYAIFEYSDIILDYEGIANVMHDQYAEESDLWETHNFVRNVTKIGYIGHDVDWVNTIVLNALTFGESALKNSANLSNAFIEDLHVIVYRWACDSTQNAAFYGSRQNKSIVSAAPVALVVNDVLSNEVVRTKTSRLLQLYFVILRVGLQESDNGLKITSQKAILLECTGDSHLSSEPQFSFCFSIDSLDKVLLALVLYPESKTLLPLPFSLGAISSYHVLEVTLVSEGNVDAVPKSSRLVTLEHVSDGPRRTEMSTACAVWTGAKWSAETCWTKTDNKHTCTCNLSAHIMSVGTFLPVLIYEAIDASNFSPKASLSALDILYVLSSTVSLVGLALIGLTAAVFPQWRADLGHKIMLHLSLALFLYQILRLYRETHHVYTALNRDVSTFIAFTALTHYSRLTHYAWMLAMSSLQLRRLLTVVGAVDTPHLLLKINLLAWGVPLVPLAVLLSWDREIHFSRPDILTHLILYLVPGSMVTLVNLILLVIILARLFSWFGWGMVDDLGRHGISDGKLMGRRMATVLLLFFLFGIPTVFEIINDFWGHSLTLEVLFKVFDPVRGTVLFVYFIVLDKKTFDMWRQNLQSLASGAVTQYFEMW